MSSFSRQQLEAYLKTIDVKGNVIDIGGSQNPIKGRTKSWNVDEYNILDLENPHHGNMPDIISDIQEEEQYHLAYLIAENGNFADIIFCIEVSEYWHNPLQALKNIHVCLKECGTLYISFHTIYPLHPPEGEDCLRYTKYGIERLMKESGFKIEQMVARKLKNDIRGLFNAEGMRGINKNKDDIHNDQGYICKCIKL